MTRADDNLHDRAQVLYELLRRCGCVPDQPWVFLGTDLRQAYVLFVRNLDEMDVGAFLGIHQVPKPPWDNRPPPAPPEPPEEDEEWVGGKAGDRGLDEVAE